MDKNKVIESAAKLIAKGQLEKAAKEFQRALDVDPDDVRILQKLAELYQKMGKKDLAADCFEKVAKTYAAQGFYLKAVALYKQVLKVVERIEVDIRLAELYQQLGLIGDAAKEWQNVAAYYEKIGDLKSSLDTLKKLVDLDPDNVAARIRLGEQYARQDNFIEAVSELRRAAAYLQRNARQDDYLRVAERISHLDQGDATLARELAESYMSRGDAKRALAKLQICFKANPRDLQTLQMLARAFQDLGQVSKTVSVLKELARVHLDGARPDEARRVFLQAAELAPDDNDIKVGVRQIDAELQASQGARGSSAGTPARGSAPGRPVSRTSAGKGAGSASTAGVPREAVASVAARPATAQKGSSAGTPATPSAAPSRAMPPPPPPMSSPGKRPTSPGMRPASSPGMRPASSPGSSAASAAVSIPKLLKETEVYVKYRLHDKALDHLARVFALEPDNTEALEKSKTLALAMQRPSDAIDALAKLVRLYSARSDPRADAAKAELRELDAANPALELPAKLGAAFGDDDEDRTSVDPPRPAAPPARTGSSAGISKPAASGSSAGISKPATSPAPSLSHSSSGVAKPAAGGSPSSAGVAKPATSSSAGRAAVAPPAPLGHPPAHELEFTDEAPAAALEAADISGEHASDPIRAQDAAAAAPSQPIVTALTESSEGVLASLKASPTHAGDPVDVALAVVDPSLDDTAESATSQEFFRSDPGEVATSAPAEPAVDHFASDLAEADFYIDAGLFDDASAILEAIMLAAPEHPGAVSRMAKIAAAGGASGEEGEGNTLLDARPAVDSDAMAAELAAELASEVADLNITDVNSGPLDSQPIDTFAEPPPAAEPPDSPRAQLQEAVRREDAQTHYDLGIAYKEMGLLDEAVAEFQLALEFGGGVRKIDCIVILATCAIEQGQPAEAVQVLTRALLEPELPPAAQRALGYELGQAYEALGERNLALAQYKAIERSERGFRDTAARITRLGGTISGPVRPKTGPIAAPAAPPPISNSSPGVIVADDIAIPSSSAAAAEAPEAPPASEPEPENNSSPSVIVSDDASTPTPPAETPAPPVANPSAKTATETNEGERRNRKIGFI